MTELSNSDFYTLTPDAVLSAVESCGLRCDGSLLALNSYENRVYRLGLEDESPVVAKFYRPHRWSDEQILEEHEFSLDLEAHEIPVVAPQRTQDGKTLCFADGFRFAIFPMRGGHWPDLEHEAHLIMLGRYLGRIHAVGRSKPFLHRPGLTIESFGEQPREYVLHGNRVPQELQPAYNSVTEDALVRVRSAFQRAGNIALIRLHGDCHPGNILWRESGPHFVDLDDCRSGPSIQDLWMLLSGDRASQSFQLSCILEGYEDFCEFNPRELHLLEALRTLRLIHYSAWLARRWEDPAFPIAFPWFGGPRFWEDQILALREQIAIMEEPPLAV